MLMRPDSYRENPESWSDVVSVLDARCALSTGLVAGGDWSVRIPPFVGLKFNALVRGEAWVQLDGESPLRLREGDCFLLGQGRAFTVASDPALSPAPAGLVFGAAADGVARIGTGQAVGIVSGKMTLDPVLAPHLSASLPPITVLAGASPQAESVSWLLQRLAKELAGDAPARMAIADRLVEIVFVELLRAAIAVPDGQAGWLAALADRRMAPVLRAMHAEPARQWALSELAGLACMSRSAFAEAFRRKVGMPPLRYLQRWRLHAAGHALRSRGVSVSEAAALAGYASESAFTSAFRRVFGATPARYADGPGVSGDRAGATGA